MIIHKCDKCGKTAEQKKGERNRNLPTGWYALVHGSSYNTSGVRYDICDECKKSLGIPDGYSESQQHVGDQLIELIGEIVHEAMESH